MKKLILFFLFSYLLFSANAQQDATLQWAKSMGGTGDDAGFSIATDDSGNIFTTGYFQSTVDFNPGPGTYNLTSSGVADIFISKLGSSGNFVWAKAMGGTGSNGGYSIAIDDSGNVFTTGSFAGTVDFDPGAGVFNLTSAGGSYDIFISKLDASGNFVWAKAMGSISGGDAGYSIAIDASGNVFTTGYFGGTVDFDPGAGVFNLTSSGGIFLSKLDASGNFVWAKAISGTISCYAYSIALDASGNVFTTGNFQSIVDFDPGSGVFNLTSAGGQDIFISKLDSSGNFVWAKRIGGASSDFGKSITLDASGNVFTTGYFYGTADFNPGTGTFNLTSTGVEDIFISKLDNSGNFVWAKRIGGASSDFGNSIAIDGSGNVYTAGYFNGTADFNPGLGTFNLTSVGVEDIFISKLDASGNFIWAKQLGGSSNDYGLSITADAAGNIYSTGYFYGTADFDPGSGAFNLTSAGSNDIFVHKMSPPYQLNLPQLVVNSASVIAGQSITFTGSIFKPNSQAKLAITGPSSFSQTISGITTNSQGSFTYTYITNSSMQQGLYHLVATDSISGLTSSVKSFTITTTTPSTAYLEIVDPTQSFLVNSSQTFMMEWKDKMVTGSGYPLSGSQRNYSYSIELSSDGGSTWQQIGTRQGTEYINNWVMLHWFPSISAPGTNNKIRVVDIYKTTNADTTAVFTVDTIINNISKVELLWDYSYPQPSVPVNGVAADGVARIFLSLSKIDTTSGPSITSVSISLSDSYNGTDYTKIGKVMAATQTNAYSSEANGTTSISASDNVSGKTNYVFWYVAPDDFVGNNTADSSAMSRFVDAVFSVNYSNSTTETITKKIRIVRPPLMLVHGLAGNPSTWDDFQHNIFGTTWRFLDDYRFKTVVPVKLNPTSHFITNAYQLVWGASGSNFINSFPGVISSMRNQGYAACRVDYIGHSMGGCIFRSVLDNFNNLYHRTGGYVNKPYKNYEQGYVNKFITIGTPHNSSPWADIVNRYVDALPSWVRFNLANIYGYYPESFPFAFVKPDNFNQLSPPFSISDAVNDLQIDQAKGGVNFQTANVKAHLIAGDFFPGTQANLPGGLIPQEYVNWVNNLPDDLMERFLNYMLQAAAASETDTAIITVVADALAETSPAERAMRFLEVLSLAMDAYNIGTFLPESDIIVGVGSQISDFQKTDPNVTVFDNWVTHTSLLVLNPEPKNISIGNRVMELLNTSPSSNKFDIIPATSNKLAAWAFPGLLSGQDSLLAIRDTNKIRISSPSDSISVFVDSVLNIHLSIKDTINLQFVNMYFQNKTYSVPPFISIDNYLSIQVNSNMIDYRWLTAEAFYKYQDSSVLVYDEIMLDVIPNDTLQGLVVNPEIMHLLIGESGYPEYYAIYQHYSTNTGNFSYGISATVNDTSIVSFDNATKRFTGIAQGETYAVVSFQGFNDTIYFAVNGCYGNSSQTVNITSSGSQNLCQGDTILLSAPSAFSYDWSTGDTTQTIQVYNAGDYSLSVTDANGCVYFSNLVIITVSPLPIVTITTDSNAAFCQGNNIFLYADSGFVDYDWNTGDTTQNISVLDSGIYVITITDSNGCSSIDSISILFNPTYTGTATTTICSGDSYTFGTQTLTTAGTYSENFASVNDCDSIVTLTLSVNPTYTETATATICSGQTYSFGSQTLSTAGIYSETFSSVTGCDSAVTLTLSVNPTYTESTTATICNGQTYTLGSQALSTAGIYTETFNSVSGCDSTVTLTLTVNPTFTETATASICSGQTYSFGSQTLSTAGTYAETFNSITGCDSIVTLTLSVNPAYSETAAAAICSGVNYVFGTQTLTTAGTYSETFNSIGGCDSIVTLTLSVNTLPDVPTISQNGDTLTSSAVSGNQWYFNGNNISNATSQFYIPDSNGNYSVLVTDANGCSASSASFNFTGIGITEYSELIGEIKIYPNPTDGTFTLEMTISNETAAEIRIYTLTGSMVYQRNVKNLQRKHLSPIDISGFSAGKYLLQVETSNGWANRRIIVK